MAETKFKNDMRITGDLTVEGSIAGNVAGDVTGNVAGSVTLPTFTVAGLPSAANNARRIVYVSNGNAGDATVAVSDGTDWLNLVTGTAVSAT